MYDFQYNAKSFSQYKKGSNADKKFLLYIQNSPPIKWDEERKCLEIYKSLDSSIQDKTEAIQKIIIGNLQYMSICITKAIKYLNNDELFMLINDMVIDLVKSIDKFDPTLAKDGVCLWNYCSGVLSKRAITHLLYSKRPLVGDVVKLSRSKKLRQKEITEGRKLSLKEVQELFDCDKKYAKNIRLWDIEYINVNNCKMSKAEDNCQEPAEHTINSKDRLDAINIPTPFDNIMLSDEKEMLKKILKRILTPRQFTVINLHFFKNYSYMSIAKELNLSKKSVDNYIFAGLRKLRKNKDIIAQSLNS